MDTNGQLDPSSIKPTLLANPRAAWQYDFTWKQLQNIFKKINFKQINTQEAWDSFYKSLSKKDLALFRFPQVVSDPNLWLIGPISQDDQVQKVISEYATTLSSEEKSPQKLHPHSQDEQSHGGSHQLEEEKTEQDKKAPQQDNKTPLATEVVGSKGVVDSKSPSKDSSHITPQEWLTHLAGTNSVIQTQPHVIPTQLIQEKPDHELIRQAEKEILRRVNVDPEVTQFYRGPNRNNPTIFRRVKQDTFQKHSRDIWDAFIREKPDLAKQFSSYAPIAAALQRKAHPENNSTSAAQLAFKSNLPYTTPPLSSHQEATNAKVIGAPAQRFSQFSSNPPASTAVQENVADFPAAPSYSRAVEPSPFLSPDESDPEIPDSSSPSYPSRPRRRRKTPGIPRIPGGITRVASLARVGALAVSPLGWGIIIAGAILLILITVILMQNDGEIGTVEVTKTVDKTETASPPDTSVCEQNPAACEKLSPNLSTGEQTSPIAFGGGSAVLSSHDTSLSDLFEGVVGGLAEFIKRVQESKITYTINVSYSGQADDIIVTDPIPDNAFFLTATGICHVRRKDVGNAKNKVYEVWWSVKENVGADLTKASACTEGTTPSTNSPATRSAQTSNTVSGGKISYSKYTGSPYYLPSSTGPSDLQYTQETISALNTLGSFVAKHQSYLISKTGGAQYVDPFLSVIWTGAIEGIGGNQYFYNCLDSIFDPNQGCPAHGFTSGGWQVGYGIQVSQATPHLAEDFEAAYGAGSASNAQKAQQVGQAVISASGGKIRNPSTFPSKSVQTLATEAQSGNLASRQAIAILLMDKELGAIALAREVAGDIKARNNWRASMEGWGQYYVNNMQKFANRASTLASLYTGEGGSSTSPGGSSFPPMAFKISILPTKETDNKLFTSSRTKVEVIGGSGGTSTSTGTGSGTLKPGEVISLDNVDKRLLPPPDAGQCRNTQTQTCGRDPNNRVRPNKIVMHVTMGTPTAESTYEYFASGSDGRGVGSHFTVGNDGKIIQMTELYSDSVEYAQTVGGYQNHISIEMGSPRTYDNRSQMPAVQYTASLSLVKALMQKYNIPIGNIEWTTSNQCYGGNQSFTIDDNVKGIFGHYQLNPCSRTDPGAGWLRDFRNDLK